MEKEYKRDKHTGYNIGKYISVHGHIHDPENWHITIRPLKIYGEHLCSKKCSEEEIARYVHVLINKIRRETIKLIDEVLPFT
jgi:hypothetical protein